MYCPGAIRIVGPSPFGDAVKRIGVVLGIRTEIAIRDVVALQPDIEIVGEVQEKFELLMMVKETRADAVILSAGEPDISGICSHLLGEYPSLTILVLGADGKLIER